MPLDGCPAASGYHYYCQYLFFIQRYFILPKVLNKYSLNIMRNMLLYVLSLFP